MAKIGGIKEIIETFRRLHELHGYRFLSPKTISEQTGIPYDRVLRILNRPSNSGLIRRSQGQKEVYTLINW